MSFKADKEKKVREYLEANYKPADVEEFMDEFYQNNASVEENIKNFKEWIKN